MPLIYKTDILVLLADKGYTTYRLTEDKLLSATIIQRLRRGEPVSWSTIETLCKLLDCQPSALLRYVKDKPDS